ncbi:MAG TPA: tetratricopeptide repeat protein [Pyrinomonadaceae bacterium]|nr:tetratricopeptide repeat protein [Pyrinomonadaceae bacterium]
MINSKFKIVILLIIVLLSSNFILAQQTLSPKMTAASELLKEKKWAEAVKALEEITKDEPNNGRAWYLLGTSLHSLGKYEKAIEAFQKNIVIAGNPASMYNIACGYSLLNQKDKAFEWLEKAIKNGFAQFANLGADKDLDNIRSDARFKKMQDLVEQQIKPCMFMPEARQFDFWAGDWDVFNTQGQKVGTNSVQPISEGCGLLENWQSTLQNNGKSINYFDQSTSKWYQFWIGSGGGALRYEGNFKDGAMRFEGFTIGKDGKKTLQRLTFFKIDENTVRQFAEISNDEGKTWTTSYDFRYVRKNTK